jgi:hypothetical protein
MKRLSLAGISAAMDVHVESGACTATVSVAEKDRVRAADVLGMRDRLRWRGGVGGLQMGPVRRSTDGRSTDGG